MPHNVTVRIHQALYGDGRIGKYFSGALGGLILLNVLAVMVETVPNIGDRYKSAFSFLEVSSLVIFTIEYLLRLWIAPLSSPNSGSAVSRIRFFFSPMALIDLLVIVTGVFPYFSDVDLRSLRILRLVRIMRLARLPRYSHALRQFASIFHAKRGDLTVVVVLMSAMVIVFSTLIYYAEHERQPQIFTSIPASMWWAIITMTTIGYGDAVPVSDFGKLIASGAAVFGVGLFTLPAGIVAAGFIERGKTPLHHAQCPHCGNPISSEGDKAA